MTDSRTLQSYIAFEQKPTLAHKGVAVAEVEQWLGSRLNYDPDAESEEREAVTA